MLLEKEYMKLQKEAIWVSKKWSYILTKNRICHYVSSVLVLTQCVSLALLSLLLCCLVVFWYFQNKVCDLLLMLN